MSTTAFGYRGFGIKTESTIIPPKFLEAKNFNDLFSLLQDKDLLIDDLEKIKSGKDVEVFGAILDGYSGEYNFYGFILQAHYIEDTHGDGYWHREFKDDEWIRTEGTKKIKEIFGFTEEPKYFDHLESWG